MKSCLWLNSLSWTPATSVLQAKFALRHRDVVGHVQQGRGGFGLGNTSVATGICIFSQQQQQQITILHKNIQSNNNRKKEISITLYNTNFKILPKKWQEKHIFSSSLSPFHNFTPKTDTHLYLTLVLTLGISNTKDPLKSYFPSPSLNLKIVKIEIGTFFFQHLIYHF